MVLRLQILDGRVRQSVHCPSGVEKSLDTARKVRALRHQYTEEGRSEMIPKRYPVVIEPTSTGYSAFSPDVPGCAAAGDTEEETRANFRDALAAHFEVMREIGEPIPEPRASVDYVEVAA